MRLPHRHDQEPDIGSLARDIADDAGGLASGRSNSKLSLKSAHLKLVADLIYAMRDLTPAKRSGRRGASLEGI